MSTQSELTEPQTFDIKLSDGSVVQWAGPDGPSAMRNYSELNETGAYPMGWAAAGSVEKERPVISADGFSATVDGYAWERHPDPNLKCQMLWYLSITASSLQGVRALWAILMKGDAVNFQFGGRRSGVYGMLWTDGPGSWKSSTYGLQNASAHQLILMPEPARFEASRTDFLMFPESEDRAAYWHMRFMRKRLPIPLWPTWDRWLWQRAKYTGEAVKLESDGVLVYRCTPNVKLLQDDIEAAGRDGALYVSEDAA